jgi:lipoprotein-anchoring transpeptidase ErfK/SrfK
MMIVGLILAGACGFGAPPSGPTPVKAQTPDSPVRVIGETESVRASIKAAPLIVPEDPEGIRVYRAAKAYKGAKILVSTENRWLWYVEGRDTLLSVPIAVGMGNNFEYKGKKWKFDTPRGRRKVLKKEENPIWTVPSWHYYEKATYRGLEAVHIEPGKLYPLEDGTWIEMRDGEVGRVNQFGNFWPFTPGIEIIFDSKLFIPPLSSPQRRVPDALGPFKLDTGDGYLIHGTNIYNEDSIGLPASHGCVRMYNEDLELLYAMVDTGTPVFIF